MSERMEIEAASIIINSSEDGHSPTVQLLGASEEGGALVVNSILSTKDARLWTSVTRVLRPTSFEECWRSEKRLLASISSPYKIERVDIGGHFINTIVFNADSDKSGLPPLVLTHGWGGGLGLWWKNFDALAQSGRTIYALDWLGMGRSSRPSFPAELLNGKAVEKVFICRHGCS